MTRLIFVVCLLGSCLGPGLAGPANCARGSAECQGQDYLLMLQARVETETQAPEEEEEDQKEPDEGSVALEESDEDKEAEREDEDEDEIEEAVKDDPDGDAQPPPPLEGSLAEGEALDKEDQVVEKAGDENFAMEESDAAGRKRGSGDDLPDHRRRYSCRRRRGDSLCNSCESCGLTGTAWKNCYYASKDDHRRRVKLKDNRRRRGSCVHPRHDGSLEDKDKKWCSCLSRVFEHCEGKSKGMACLTGDHSMGPACSCSHMCNNFKKALGCKQGSLLSASPGGQLTDMSVANHSSSLDEVLAGKRTCG